jgi:hypothetical protein
MMFNITKSNINSLHIQGNLLNFWSLILITLSITSNNNINYIYTSFQNFIFGKSKNEKFIISEKMVSKVEISISSSKY